MGKCNEIISKMMHYDEVLEGTGAILHVDSEEKSARYIILFSNITVCICIVNIIIIDTINSTRIK